MKHLTTVLAARFLASRPRLAAVFGILTLVCAGTAEAQILSAPRNTRALPPVEAEADGVGLIASGAAKGAERAFRAVMPEASGAEVLNGLRDGQTVAVLYHPQGDQGGGEQMTLVGGELLEATEGMVTDVSRRRAEVSIRFDDRTTGTFRVARQDVGPEGEDASRVLIYYPNAAGEKEPHTFVRVSQARSPRTR
jgi:hypothetical protein